MSDFDDVDEMELGEVRAWSQSMMLDYKEWYGRPFTGHSMSDRQQEVSVGLGQRFVLVGARMVSLDLSLPYAVRVTYSGRGAWMADAVGMLSALNMRLQQERYGRLMSIFLDLSDTDTQALLDEHHPEWRLAKPY